jgi:nitrate/nitrite transport system ATP-binding protein
MLFCKTWPRGCEQLAHDPQYHPLRSQVLEFLYSRQIRPKEAA